MTLTEQFIDLTEEEALVLEVADWDYPPELEAYDLDDIGASTINLNDDYEGF